MGTAPMSDCTRNGVQSSFRSLQDIQNEQPYANLSNKIHLRLQRPILASKNLMRLNAKKVLGVKNLYKTHGITNCEDQSNDGKMSDSLSRQILIPVFNSFCRLKVKRPVFSMVRINPKKFLKMKESAITDDYELLNQIGKGGFGSVYKAIKKNSHEVRAIKKINKSTLQQQQKVNIMNEFDILCKLDHPNIIKLYDIYDDDQCLYVVTELCEGGNLLHFVNQARLTEKMMKDITMQLLNAVRYMHSFRIIHRDIKLENIVLLKKVENDEEKIIIKLIDFGISVNMSKIPNYSRLEPMGTLIYMAPESFKENTGPHCDVWSCGIALYMMATRKIPYAYKNQSDLHFLIDKGEIVRKNLHKLSIEFKLLINQLLEKNPDKRITAERAIYSPWLKDLGKKQAITFSKRAKAAKNLFDYDAKNNFVSLIESYLIFKKISQEQRQRLACIFQSIDQDKSGIIQIEQLKKFYSQNSQFYDESEVEALLHIIDKNKSGKIDFNEFIAAMYDRLLLFQLQSLQQAFDFFDKDKSGQISREQLEQILQGVKIQQIEYIFDALDKNNDSKICKKQFLAYLSRHEQ